MRKESIWTDSCGGLNRLGKPLEGDIKTDVLIIGAGMTGILCAHALHKEGVSCVVVDGKRIGQGVTCNTTAKITAQHALIYADLIEKFGVNTAQQYYEANREAVEKFRTIAQKYPCDLENKRAFVYTLNDPAKIEREAKAYHTLGISECEDKNFSLPFTVKGALSMADQAQFHPLKLLYALSEGLEVYENTFVNEIKDGKAFTATGTIAAEHIVLATHYPLVNVPGLYFMKLYQERSYVVALKNGPQVDGMFIDEKNGGYSFRNYHDYLLVGGGGHKTGKKGGGYAELLQFTARNFPSLEVSYAWATQDCISLDGMPYIGVHRKSAPHLYVATGFNKWGMTGSMTAASVLTDMIVHGESPYGNLFSPRRKMPIGPLAGNIAAAAAGLLRVGKRCTHLGCALQWNESEQSWDCACHGSRFSKDGSILNNPAKKEKKF